MNGFGAQNSDNGWSIIKITYVVAFNGTMRNFSSNNCRQAEILSQSCSTHTIPINLCIFLYKVLITLFYCCKQSLEWFLNPSIPGTHLATSGKTIYHSQIFLCNIKLSRLKAIVSQKWPFQYQPVWRSLYT
jgi:hypothetical protein